MKTKLSLYCILGCGLFALDFAAHAQLPTNQLTPAGVSLVVTTNGVLLSPTNFFATNAALVNGAITGSAGSSNVNATNLIGVVSKSNGGLGIAMTNWIPSGATSDNGAAWGYSQYTVTVNAADTYFFDPPATGDESLLYGGDLSGSVTYPGGIFVPGTNRIQIFCDANNTALKSRIFLVTNRLYADWRGQFTGVLAAGSAVPDEVLSGKVLLKTNSLLAYATNGGSEHFLYSSNTANGSTLSLIRYGNKGYADINFFVAPSLAVAQGSPTLKFAIGAGADGTNQFPYNWPYIELYGSHNPFYFVGASEIWGGVLNTATTAYGDFVWFKDGTTNTPMFRISRANNVISNYYPAVFQSNVTVLANGQFIGNGAGVTNLSATELRSGTLATNRYTRTGVLRNIYVDAGAMYAAPTNGATVATNSPTNGIYSDAWTFAVTSTNAVWFKLALPDTWAQTPLKVKTYWTCTGTNAASKTNIVWDIAAVDVPNSSNLAAASLGTAQQMTFGLGTNSYVISTNTSSALTVGGTINTGDMLWFQIRGLGGHASWAETNTAVQLLGATIQYQENATEPSNW